MNEGVASRSDDGVVETVIMQVSPTLAAAVRSLSGVETGIEMAKD